MAYNYEYPYVAQQRYNDDWLLNKVKEMDIYIHTALLELMREQIDKLFVDASYDQENERLILILSMEET